MSEEERAEDDAYDAWLALTDAEHRVTWELEEERIYGAVQCLGDETSGCHAYCPQGCETFPCAHLPVQGKTCGRIPFFDDGSMEQFYKGPSTTPRDGVIVLVWEQDYYLWHYADDEPVTP